MRTTRLARAAVLGLVCGLPGATCPPLGKQLYAQNAPLPSAGQSRPATLVILLPADAELFVQNQKIRGSGGQRQFKSPALDPAKKYTYTIRIVWMDRGKQQSLEQRVPVRAGEEVVVDLVQMPSQPVAPPVASPPATNKEEPADAPAEKPAELTADEKGILELTNKERAKAGSKPLVANAQLTAAARGHSTNMARQKVLNHTLDGKQFFQRIEATGYQSGAAGENIAYGARTPAEVLNMWMNSEGHKTNILNSQYQQIGIGVAAAADGTKYYTQVFATPLEIPQQP